MPLRRAPTLPPMVYNRIALFRTERGLTRKALAEAVEVNPPTIGFLDRGDDMLVALEPCPPLADQLGESASSAVSP